jgi:hypothetical protein
MESMIIVTHRGCELEELRRSIPDEYHVDDAAHGIVIESASQRAYLTLNADLRDELEPEELALILSSIHDPVFYTLDYHDPEFCRQLLLAIADRADVLVDNDHGVLLSGSEFVRILRSQPDWDWRRDLP